MNEIKLQKRAVYAGDNGYVKRKDIKKTLAEEYKVAYTGGEKG